MRIKIIILILVFLSFSSCRANEDQSHILSQIPDATITFTPAVLDTFTPVPIVPQPSPFQTSTIISSPTVSIPMTTPDPTATLVNTYNIPLSRYTGKIFINPDKEGKYIIADLDNHKEIFSKIPSQDWCELYKGDQIICQEEPDDGKLYLYMWRTESKTLLPIPNAKIWHLTSDEKKLYYGIEAEKDQFSFYSYDIQNEHIETLGIIKSSQWAEPSPRLSNDGSHFIGVYSIGDNRFGLYEVKGQQVQQIYNGDYSATPDLAWSPNESILGFGVETGPSEVGWYSSNFMVYNAKTGIIKKIAQAPNGKSYGLFQGNSIWSPDGKKVALTVEGNICIIDIETTSQNCYRIWNQEEPISGYAWSPDSTAIAFTSQRITNDLRVFSIGDQKTETILTNIENAASIIWK
jgi:hypothetical protein